MFTNDILFFLMHYFAVIFLLYVKEQFNLLNFNNETNKDNIKFVMVSCIIMRSDVQNCIFSQNQHGDYLFIDGIAKSDQGSIY